MGKIYDVQRYNLVNSSDGVHVRVNAPDSLTVLFNQYGTWWWREPTNYGPRRTACARHLYMCGPPAYDDADFRLEFFTMTGL